MNTNEFEVTVSKEKIILRKGIWKGIREAGVARFPGVEGRIPNFVGAEEAARKLGNLKEFKNAKTLKCNPDSPQRPVRHLALKEGKTVFMAVPKLRDTACFVALDPKKLGKENLWKASSAKGAFQVGELVRPDKMPKIDLIVTGCVGAGLDSVRLGKGGGYADLEYAILLEVGCIDPDVLLVTTVHDCQILPEGMVPRSPWDLSLDIIVTQSKVHMVENRYARAEGIQWHVLPEEKIEAIPYLRELRERRK